MKKIPFIIWFILIASVAIVMAKAWQNYTSMSGTDLADGDDFLARDISDTTDSASGTVLRKSWGDMREQLRTDRPIGFTAIDALTASDDFCLPWKNTTGETVVIQNIYGVLESGTNVVGGFDVCDNACDNCVAVDSDITFNGGEDTDDGSLSSPNIASNYKLRWHTTSVSSPGNFSVGLTYK